MLITIQLADFKIANHLKDPMANYISELKASALSTKKGIASDRFQFSLPLEALDSIGEPFSYLLYNTPAKVFLDDTLLFVGYVSKLDTKANNLVSMELTSQVSWQLKQFFSPSIEGTCQSQAYSKQCKLNKENFKFSFNNVELNCMTGYATVDISGDTISLGTASSSVGPYNNDQFLLLDNWWQAIVVINGKYKSQVVNVTENKIYFAMNYLDKLITATTLDVYLKCDGTYGTCYSRYNNVEHFWGFANVGRKVSTIDIFSATSLDYCGEDSAAGPLETCPTDNNFFGVEL